MSQSNVPGTVSVADEVLDRLVMWGQKLGLERIREVLARLGDPQLAVPCVLIAGTNGKGSTSAALASILQASGYKTGLYNSPHLESVEERIRISGRSLEAAVLGELLEEIVAAAEDEGGDPPTYFEAMTSAAFLAFARESVDVAVLEVGLGGRLDATNVCEPVLSVISQIAFDHQEHLGNTLEKIAGEKAGIMRKERSTVAWFESGSEIQLALEEQARVRGAKLIDAAAGVGRRADTSTEDLVNPGAMTQRIDLATPAQRYRFKSVLLGAHQHDNLALAIRAAEELQSLGFPRIESESVVRGLESVHWPGRLEWVEVEDPGSGTRRILLDGAHNGAGAEALARYLESLGVRPVLLFGSLARKNVGTVLPRLARNAERVILTAPPSDRALDPQELADLIQGAVSFEVERDPGAALEMALRDLTASGENGDVLVVCGSLYLVGFARVALREKFGVPVATTEMVLGAPLPT